MSELDTKMIRERVNGPYRPNSAQILDLCDEVDRLGAELAAAKEVECVALDARDLHAKRAQAAEAKARDEWAARNEAEKRASEYKAQKEAAEKELADLKEGQHMNCVHRHRLEDVEAKLARTLSDNKFLKMCPAFDEKVPCGTCLSCLSRKLAQAERDHIVRINEMVEQRDEALTKWHAHQKNVPCSGCEGGHDTFWKSVVESPQWKAWEASGPEWDVDECRACGHISQAHFQAFMGFIVGGMLDRAMKLEAELAEVRHERDHGEAV